MNSSTKPNQINFRGFNIPALPLKSMVQLFLLRNKIQVQFLGWVGLADCNLHMHKLFLKFLQKTITYAKKCRTMYLDSTYFSFLKKLMEKVSGCNVEKHRRFISFQIPNETNLPGKFRLLAGIFEV